MCPDLVRAFEHETGTDSWVGISSDGIGLSYKNKFKHKKTNTKYEKYRNVEHHTGTEG